MEAKEYLKNYKEKALAEMCEKKDEEIDNLINDYDEEIDKLVNDYNDLLQKYENAKIYQDAFKSPCRIVEKIETLSVDEFLKVYHMLQNKVNNSYASSYMSMTSNGIVTKVTNK